MTAAVVAVRAYTEENVAAVLLYCSITYYYCCVPVVDFTSPAAVVTLVFYWNARTTTSCVSVFALLMMSAWQLTYSQYIYIDYLVGCCDLSNDYVGSENISIIIHETYELHNPSPT